MRVLVCCAAGVVGEVGGVVFMVGVIIGTGSTRLRVVLGTGVKVFDIGVVVDCIRDGLCDAGVDNTDIFNRLESISLKVV